MLEGDFISGCLFRGSEGAGLSISHLFADDTIVFFKTFEDQMLSLS